MNIEFFSKIKKDRQDGAISNGFLFSLNHQGECSVYETKSLECSKDSGAEVFSEFVLDKTEILLPHSNSVMFGNEYYEKNDEFPLLYTNVYNNYDGADNKLEGICLVYRLQRKEKIFTSTLVQVIEIGFVANKNLWKSAGEADDVRPYGNFTIDTQKNIYYAFTMRDNSNSTRYFAFDLPKVDKGVMCEKCNAKRVMLNEPDIIQYFDCDYHHYIQGACCHDGKIYSLEGFTDSIENPPAIRIIDTNLKKEIYFKKFTDLGISLEPEMINFENDTCYFTCHNGDMYKITF